MQTGPTASLAALDSICIRPSLARRDVRATQPSHQFKPASSDKECSWCGLPDHNTASSQHFMTQVCPTPAIPSLCRRRSPPSGSCRLSAGYLLRCCSSCLEWHIQLDAYDATCVGFGRSKRWRTERERERERERESSQ